MEMHQYCLEIFSMVLMLVLWDSVFISCDTNVFRTYAECHHAFKKSYDLYIHSTKNKELQNLKCHIAVYHTKWAINHSHLDSSVSSD